MPITRSGRILKPADIHVLHITDQIRHAKTRNHSLALHLQLLPSSSLVSTLMRLLYACAEASHSLLQP